MDDLQRRFQLFTQTSYVFVQLIPPFASSLHSFIILFPLSDDPFLSSSSLHVSPPLYLET